MQAIMRAVAITKTFKKKEKDEALSLFWLPLMKFILFISWFTMW